ncbi:MAG: hypothetical protein U0271_38010 [Polyangiaceae bacterium]
MMGRGPISGALAALAIVGCSAEGNPASHARSSAQSASVATSTSAAASASVVSASSSAAVAESSAPVALEVTRKRAQLVLFPEGVPSSCDEADAGFVRCLVAARFEGHASEQKAALALFDELGDVVGLESEQDMDGGFRGTIHLVPELPVGKHAKHLEWVLGAGRQIEAFLKGLEERAKSPPSYRHRALAFRFMRSVGRTTPSAYAASWEVGYNVSGSLNTSADAVRDTLFHEVFHLNDEEHGNWSRRVLGPMVDRIAEKCGTKTACLAPYAPFKTMVRGGTYYAFTPNNGDMSHEYAAELATRYFLEQRAALAGGTYPGGWFKCGAAENAEAYAAIAKEFFAGVDLTVCK